MEDKELISRYDYTVNAVGNWTAMSQKMLTKSIQTFDYQYQYDSIDQLIGVTAPDLIQAYAYDAVGNRVTKTENSAVTSYASNNLNQYTSTSLGTSTQALSYDPNGNLSEIRNSESGIVDLSIICESVNPIIIIFGTIDGIAGAVGTIRGVMKIKASIQLLSY